VTRLADADWRRVTVHDMHLAFLVAERERYAPALARFGPGLVDAPDLADPEQNRLRMRMLYYMRRHLVGEIPPDTEWHEVRWLTDEHVDELRVIGRCEWDNPLDRNQLRRVAARAPRAAPPTLPLGPIVLWGHGRGGPFTILEGNHRLTALVAAGAQFQASACVGLSPSGCYWHLEDPAAILINDLWRS